MHGNEYMNDFKYIYIFSDILAVTEYDACGIQSVNIKKSNKKMLQKNISFDL